MKSQEDPKEQKREQRRLLMSTAMSVLLYKATVWSDAVNMPYRKVEVEKIARIPPVELIVEERTAVYKAIKKVYTKQKKK